MLQNFSFKEKKNLFVLLQTTCSCSILANYMLPLANYMVLLPRKDSSEDNGTRTEPHQAGALLGDSQQSSYLYGKGEDYRHNMRILPV